MHLVFINQYYPPDEAPTGLMLEEVAIRLIEKGHQVTILCASGGYTNQRAARKRQEPVSEPLSPLPRLAPTVRRLGASRFGRGTFIGKLADYASFYLQVAWHLGMPGPRINRVIALTTPPYLSILARFFSKFKGADHAHWVMDLYPDVMWAHGIIRKQSLAGWMLTVLAKWGMGGKRCFLVLTLGPDMQERTARYHSPSVTSAWVPLWGTTNPISSYAKHDSTEPPQEIESIAPASSSESELVKSKSPLRLMYSGNMGLGHRFDEFLQAALKGDGTFDWLFNGDGKRRPEIERFLQLNPSAPLILGDYVPRDHLAIHLESADVHLASLEPSWDGTMVPSKLQGIFTIGRPVIFVGSKTSSMARWILESGGGWVIAPGDHVSLEQALHEALDDSVRIEKGRAASRFAAQHFDRFKNSEHIATFLIQAQVKPLAFPGPTANH